MFRFLIVCFCLCFLLVNPAHATDYTQLKQWFYDARLQGALKAPNQPSSTSTLQQLHGEGNHFAGWMLAQRHVQGIGVDKDVPKAVSLLQPLADQGFGPAQGFLGSILMNGYGDTPAQPKKAVPLMIKGAKWGYANSMLDLGMAYLQGHVPGGAGQLYEGYKWISRAAQQGVANAKTVKVQLESKYGVPKPTLQGGMVVSKGISIDPLTDNMGFTETFAGIYYSSPVMNDTTIKVIKTRALGVHPIYYYELARRLAHADAEEAVYWYLVGAYRMRYHTQRCTDKTASGVTQVMALGMNSEDQMAALKQVTDSGKIYEIYKKAVNDAAKMPLETDPTWACRTGMATVMATMRGEQPANLLKPRKQWRKINETLKTDTLKIIEKKYAPKQ